MLKKMLLSCMSIVLLVPASSSFAMNKDDGKTALISFGVCAITEVAKKIIGFGYGKLNKSKTTEKEVSEDEQPLLKKDAKNFITTEALNGYAKKNEIPNLDNYAKKNEFTQYALKREIPNTENFATKNDIKDFVIKKYLDEYVTEDNLNTVLINYVQHKDIDERINNIEALVNKLTPIKHEDEKDAKREYITKDDLEKMLENYVQVSKLNEHNNTHHNRFETLENDVKDLFKHHKKNDEENKE